MNVFDIKNSIIKPFDRISQGDIPRFNPVGTLVEDYVSRNLTCGAAELNNLKMLMSASNNQVQGSLREIGSVVKVLDNCVESAFNIGIAAAGVLDSMAALTDKLASVNLAVPDLGNINFSLPDLNLGLTVPDATAIKGLFNSIGNGLNSMMNSALTALGNFSPENLVDSMLDFGLDIPLGDDPISNIAAMLECQEDGVLGLLEVGLSNMMTSSFSGNDSVNPLSATMSLVASVRNGVGGAVNAVNGAINSVSGAVGGSVNSLIGEANSSLSAINPILGGFLRELGVPSLVNTALSDAARSALGSSKSYSACQTAQALNKFGNYDPFVASVLGVSGLAAANSKLYGSSGRSSLADACKCCVKKKQKYADEDSYAIVSRGSYDLARSYRQSISADPSADQHVRLRNIPADDFSKVINAYGFSEENVLTASIGTSLESYRLARKLKGNMAELAADFTKYSDFESEATSDLKYVRSLNEDLIQENIAQIDSLVEVAHELAA